MTEFNNTETENFDAEVLAAAAEAVDNSDDALVVKGAQHLGNSIEVANASLILNSLGFSDWLVNAVAQIGLAEMDALDEAGAEYVARHEAREAEESLDALERGEVTGTVVDSDDDNGTDNAEEG